MEVYGRQCDDDDPFKAAARMHQSHFRVHELGVERWRDYGSRLPTAQALAGVNFYPWPGLLDAVDTRFRRGDKKLYWDMLGSDHVPFNFFIPLRALTFTQQIISTWTHDNVGAVSRIEIEWAPAPKADFLDDNTSFDVYVEYERNDGRFGAVGIEVKYTERAYSWGARERTQMQDPASVYRRVHQASDLYEKGAIDALATRPLKQLWRNQLLGESMLRRRSALTRFTSVLLYPSANDHFARAVPTYVGLLKREAAHRFAAVTYEDFIAKCRSLDSAPATTEWLGYLEKRYIVRARNETGRAPANSALQQTWASPTLGPRS